MTLANLTILKDGVTVKTLPVQGDAWLGRAKECEIRLDDQAISRKHALFQYVGSALHIVKKSEFAPLIINGIESSDTALKEGDVLSLGPYIVRVSFAQAVVSSAPPIEVVAAVDPKPDATLDSAGDGVLGMEGGLAEISPDMNLGMDLESSPENSDAEKKNESASEGAALEGLDFSKDASENSGAVLPGAEVSEGSGENFSEIIDEDGKTKVLSVQKISAKLIFKRGTANVTEYDLNKDSTSLGRGKDCDVVLIDKKCSRKNSIIRREGVRFIIEDLGSVNGTYVNKSRIQEHELSGNDLIKIGGVEFEFRAISADYASREKDFGSVSQDVESSAPDLSASDLAPDLGGSLEAPDPHLGNGAILLDPGAGVQPAAGIDGVPGITGISGGSTKKGSLIEKFRTLPKRTQVIGVILAILVGAWIMEDDPPAKVKVGPKKGAVSQKSPNPSASGGASEATFDALSPEKKQFVENQHSLAFDHYKNKDYDQAIYEIEKIFTIVADYKDSKEIQRYAKEGQRRRDAIEEERRKKDEEGKLKAKILDLTNEAKKLMAQKAYDQAKEVFVQIISLDPDNGAVSAWNKEIEAYEERIKSEAQQKQMIREINAQGWSFYREGLSYKKQHQFYSAIHEFQQVSTIGITDKGLLQKSKSMIAQCYAAIKSLRDPVLKEAKELESSAEYVKAFALFQKATRIDPHHPAGFAGMNRIKSILHERAKGIYTEALLAESYSDFTNAQKLFKECVQMAPLDDIYHERAARKLARYFKRGEEPQ